MNNASLTPDSRSFTPDGMPNCCPACGGEVLGMSSLSDDSPCPHCGQPLWFLRRTLGEVLVLTFLPGTISVQDAGARADEVLSVLGDCSRLVLNLSRLRFVSSTFLAMIVVLHRRMASAGGKLKLCGLQQNSLEALLTTRLDTIFAIYEDEQAAVESF